jgi:putative heme-binding domain-containing protein
MSLVRRLASLDPINMNYRLISSLVICLLGCVMLTAEDPLRVRNDAIIVRAVQRMPGYDYSNDEHVQAAISRHLARAAGTEDYLALAKQFRPDDMPQRLQELLTGKLSDSAKVEAAALLCEASGGTERLTKLLHSESVDQAAQVATILGIVGNGIARELLADMAGDETQPFEVRKNAVSGLAKSAAGQNLILQLASNRRLAADTRLLAGGLLARSDNETIRQRTAKLLPQPQQKDQKPLAPIDQLAAMRGDVDNGMKLFRGVATCSNCHVIDKFGKEVGPDLSEIGSKLSREAMYTSILDPSAGISHNYENFSVLTIDGQVISGLKVSETPEEVVIRTPEAIDRRIPQADIEVIKKTEKSIMPENLHHTIDQKGLVDVVEYMSSLTKK